MKKGRIFFVAALAAGLSSVAVAQEGDPVLMTIDGQAIKRSEFEYAFNKNNVNVSDNGQTVDEYLPLFIDFKLKVAEAKAQRLDTLASFKAEYANDRAALAEEYLTDKNYIEEEARRVYMKDSATIGKDGFVKVAHIAFRLSQKATDAEIAAAKAKIDSAYVMLKEGKTFDEIGEHFRIHKNLLKPFEIIRGQAYEEFENVVYSLTDGEYSEPFRSPAAYHIAKRISVRPFGSFEEYRKPIMDMLEQQNIRQAARMKKGFALAEEMGGGLTPEQALAREDSLLETKYPEFGHLMREYYEGLLFFEISNREIWKNDASEEKAIAKYFKKNKKKYKFDTPRFRGAVAYADSQENMDKLKGLLTGKSVDEYRKIVGDNFLQDSARVIRLELGVYAIGDNGWVDKFAFGQGEGGRKRADLPFVDVVGQVIDAPETYKDVKGVVTEDYNKYKEEKWLKKLRKKYDVEVNEEVLRTVNNHD